MTYLEFVFDGFLVDNNKSDWIKVIMNACISETNIKAEDNARTDYIEDVNAYKKLLTDTIVEWLESLKCQVLQEKDFVTFAAKDLSSSIVARYKFLQCYPNRISYESEMEFLKYLIIIWINKVLGGDNTGVLKNVNTLLNKIISFQNRFKLKVARSEELYRREKSFDKKVLLRKNSEYLRNVICGIPTGIDNHNNEEENFLTPKSNINVSNRPKSLTLMNNTDNNIPFIKARANSFKRKVFKDVSLQIDLEEINTNPWDLKSILDYNVCVFLNKANPTEYKPIQCIYNQYSEILKTHCYELEFNVNEDKMEIIRNSVLNNVWKIYYRLISDPGTDSSNFNALFEEQFEESLSNSKYLPELENMLEMRRIWKANLSLHVNNMYRRIQETKNGLLFRRSFQDVFCKEFKLSLQQNQLMVLMRLCDYFVMYSKFKENDVFKAYIYKQRLTTTVEVLFNNKGHIKTHINEDIVNLLNKVFKTLDKIVLNEDIINDEASEITFREKLDTWLKALPLENSTQSDDEISRIKIITVLAKNVNIITKIHNDKAVREKEIEKEMTQFLQTQISDNVTYSECLCMVKNFLEKLNFVQDSKNAMDSSPKCSTCIQTNEHYDSVEQTQNNAVQKVESRVRFEDTITNCNSKRVQYKPAVNKKTGILKDTKKYNKYTSENNVDFEEPQSSKSICSGCNPNVISYQENIRLDDSDDSITIIENLPNFKSESFQIDFPINEGTNTEHLFIPANKDKLVPNGVQLCDEVDSNATRYKFLYGEMISVTDKYSQTSIDCSENYQEKRVFCQKCRSLIEEDDTSDEYNDSEEY
ncbi:unnamed protein product [Colias eurytheme]|nr:unnamed protein product [Colias eurytheme]